MADIADKPSAVWLDRQTPPHIATLVLIAGVAALNMNIFLPSLPSMAAFFQADYALVQLTVSAYLGVTAILQLVIGPLSDRYGRRPVLIVSIVVFLLATLGCVLATNIYVFLTFRLIQASVAGGLVLSRAIVRDMVDTARAASMIGYVTMGMSLVPMVGPLIGGILDETFGWQASFLFTGLFGVIVLAIVAIDLGETISEKSGSFGSQVAAYPELLTSRRFWGYSLTAAFASGAFFAFLGGGPYVASEVLQVSPALVGFYFGFPACGYMLGNFLSGQYVQRVGINEMMLAGSIVAAAGMALSLLLFIAGFTHPLALFGPIFFLGLGNGMCLPSANAGIVSVRPNLAGSASGLGGALMIGGGAGLSAVTGALVNPETGVWSLLGMMLASATAGILATLYVISVERRLNS